MRRFEKKDDEKRSSCAMCVDGNPEEKIEAKGKVYYLCAKCRSLVMEAEQQGVAVEKMDGFAEGALALAELALQEENRKENATSQGRSRPKPNLEMLDEMAGRRRRT